MGFKNRTHKRVGMVMNTRKISGVVSGTALIGTALADASSAHKHGVGRKHSVVASAVALALGVAMLGWQGSALADARTQAKRLHDRIAGFVYRGRGFGRGAWREPPRRKRRGELDRVRRGGR